MEGLSRRSFFKGLLVGAAAAVLPIQLKGYSPGNLRHTSKYVSEYLSDLHVWSAEVNGRRWEYAVLMEPGTEVGDPVWNQWDIEAHKAFKRAVWENV